MKRIMFLLCAVLTLSVISGCEKMTPGCGTLIVKVVNPTDYPDIDIYPYVPVEHDFQDNPVICHKELKSYEGSATFELNVGNYIVTNGYHPSRRPAVGVQIKEGETTTITLE